MYEKELKLHIQDIVKNKKKLSFEHLCKLSKGAFPVLIYSLIDNKLKTKYKKKYQGLKELNNIIPEENPINYDWRFDNFTIKKIIELVKLKKYKKIALFGTPS